MNRQHSIKTSQEMSMKVKRKWNRLVGDRLVARSTGWKQCGLLIDTVVDWTVDLFIKKPTSKTYLTDVLTHPQTKAMCVLLYRVSNEVVVMDKQKIRNNYASY